MTCTPLSYPNVLGLFVSQQEEHASVDTVAHLLVEDQDHSRHTDSTVDGGADALCGADTTTISTSLGQEGSQTWGQPVQEQRECADAIQLRNAKEVDECKMAQ